MYEKNAYKNLFVNVNGNFKTDPMESSLYVNTFHGNGYWVATAKYSSYPASHTNYTEYSESSSKPLITNNGYQPAQHKDDYSINGNTITINNKFSVSLIFILNATTLYPNLSGERLKLSFTLRGTKLNVTTDPYFAFLSQYYFNFLNNAECIWDNSIYGYNYGEKYIRQYAPVKYINRNMGQTQSYSFTCPNDLYAIMLHRFNGIEKPFYIDNLRLTLDSDNSPYKIATVEEDRKRLQLMGYNV